MATLFERISLIVRSKASSLIEKLEDPAELVDQTIVDAKKEYAESLKASADVFAEEKKTAAEVTNLQNEKSKYDTVAERAVAAGNDDDARQALTKSADLEARIVKAQDRYNRVHTNAENLRSKLVTLKDGIKDMEQRAAEIKADMATADAVNKASKVAGQISGNAFATFDRLAEKAEKERMSAEAMSEFDDAASKDEGSDLLDKYSANGASASVEEKLAALKAKAAGK